VARRRGSYVSATLAQPAAALAPARIVASEDDRSVKAPPVLADLL